MPNKTISLEKTSCAFCDSNDFDILFFRKDLNTNLPGDFRVVKCKNCGLVYLNPRPTQKSIQQDIYPEEYDQYLEVKSKHPLQNWFQNYGFLKRYKYISKFKPGGKLLDVGCATGDFLSFMQKQPNWEVAGVEPILEAAELCRKRTDAEVYNGFLADSNFSDSSFDVVTFWHVFEHLEDPINALAKVHRILKKDGLVIITIPVINSIDHKLFGKYWIGFELPRHLFFFSKENLSNIFKKTGFALQESKCLYGSHAMTMTSLKFWLRSKKFFSNKFIEIVIKIMMSYPIRISLFPIFFFLDKFKKSTPMTFTAKKCGN